jgi:uncharacterized protein DUF3634
VDWLGNVLMLLVAGVVIWLLWQASRPPRLFVVRINAGEPHVLAGTVTPAFLQRVREVVTEHGITVGQVYGVSARGNRIRLEFAGRFPPAARQQLRNWWAESGWTAGPGRK